MALGFGFNKAKVLASAEKFVQQGKLPNAITEYEKVIKEDPKDLTVLNTIGDLYARVGQNEHAAHYFKKVGEQYAQSGFTVKAIAVYKKLSKLTPNNAEYIMRLAELYTQQGLLNDARAQYMQIADAHLRSGEHNSAARVLQRVLELDPENTATQAKLADLYLKLGRREEALKIYSSAAESLYARGSHDAAKDALSKVITLDPGNPEALLLRGMMAADAGDNPAAVNYLEQVRDIDSRPSALRALLRAQLGSDSPEGADSVAGKLLTLHNDMSGVTTLAEWYLNNGQTANATRLCEMHADRLNAAGPGAVRESIRQLLQNVKSSPGTPSRTSELVPRSGDAAQTAELMEQQAHDFAKRGEYERARDLYKRLAEMEPENALHAQNYRQMLDKLGADSATRILTPEEAAQAFMVEELDENAAVVHQKYDPPTESAIEAALTDAELFVSYNVPSKAIPPLEAALPLAPHDITLNQRLATLYSRAGRFADAAKVCQTLSDIYRELGHEKEAAKYQEATRKYNLRAGVITPAARAQEPPSSSARPSSTLPDTQEIAAEAEPSVKEFSFDIPDHLMTEPEQPPVVPTEIITEPAAAAEQEFNVQIAPTPGASPEPQEIDISSEWEDMLTVEEQEPEQPVAIKGAMPAQEPEPPVQIEEPEGGSKVCYAVDEKVEEINSLISQQKWDAARAAILKLTETAPEAPEINELMAAVAAGQRKQARAQQASEPAVAAKMEPAPIDFLPPPFAAPAPPAMPEAAQEFTVQSGKPRSIPEIEPLLEIEEEKAPPPPVKKPSAPAAKASAPPPSPPAAASA
ncbi:MAG TPA: tetratricopeptide repeat protein, partial [Candidatus Limnocylindrales bacterium]|nr:tetratricopeptide repeat protein [Candidatus Limnocylindrales bacterium]